MIPKMNASDFFQFVIVFDRFPVFLAPFSPFPLVLNPFSVDKIIRLIRVLQPAKRGRLRGARGFEPAKKGRLCWCERQYSTVT